MNRLDAVVFSMVVGVALVVGNVLVPSLPATAVADGGSIAGTISVRGSETHVVDGLLVTLIDESDAEVATTATDILGAYSFDPLVPGNYRVRIEDPDARGYVSTWWPGVLTKNESELISLDLDERKSANIQISAGAFLSSLPVLSGTPRVGSDLAASLLDWSPIPEVVKFQWLRDGVNIPGASSSGYAVTVADAGASLAVQVTASSFGYETVTVTSSAVSAFGEFSVTSTPTISGLPKLGTVLTASAGEWVPTPADLTYQWNRGGVPISGANSSSYTVSAADPGTALSVTVTGSSAGYSVLSRTSLATAVITGGVITASPFPTIAGTAKFGSVLTAVTGTWGPAPITLSYQWKRNGATISGATLSTYTPTTADAAATLVVTVTGSRSGYTAITRTSAATTPVTGVPFVTAPVPTISGTAAVGSTLTGSAGAWSPVPGLAYAWARNGSAISGATATTYKVTAADAGAKITFMVSASRAGYAATSRTSVTTAIVTGGVLTLAPTPTVSGPALVGSILTAKPGVWGPGAVALNYQWKRNGIAIAGATAVTYKLALADAGAQISVTVTGSRVGFTTLSKTSATLAARGVFTVTPIPTISGSAVVGSTLTANSGAWIPTAAFTYRWTRNGVSISGATSASYRLTAADGGQQIRVVVTASRAAFTAVDKTSASVTPPGAFTAKPSPTVSGDTVVGSVLTANPGTWSPVPTSFSYQWRRNGVAIPGATGKTYTVGLRDVDASLSVVVTGVKSGYTSATTGSAAKVGTGRVYANCDALNRDYPHGVARPGVTVDMVSGKPKPLGSQTVFSASVYNLNPLRDGDKDGIACEKH